MDSDSRQALRSILNDHLTAMYQEVGSLRTLWNPLLPSVPAASAETKPPPADWQATVSRLFPTVESADQISTWGLAGGENSGLDASTLAPNLARRLADAQTWLDRLSEQLTRPEAENRSE
jgi:hypothetical protein